jgi:hypothetical protein
MPRLAARKSHALTAGQRPSLASRAVCVRSPASTLAYSPHENSILFATVDDAPP